MGVFSGHLQWWMCFVLKIGLKPGYFEQQSNFVLGKGAETGMKSSFRPHKPPQAYANPTQPPQSASSTLRRPETPRGIPKTYILSVSFCTTLKFEKNSLANTLSTVYVGMAMSIPTIPATLPAMRITRKISSGWAFTLLE